MSFNKTKVARTINRRSSLYTNQPDSVLKPITTFIPESSYLQFRTDMHIDGIRRINDFFAELILMYLNKDEDFLICLDKIKENISRQSKTKRVILHNELLKGKEVLKKFQILNEEEKNNLFDVLEKEITENEMYKP
jgi:hypothetical protein